MPRRRNNTTNLPLDEKFDVHWFAENSHRAVNVLHALHASRSPKRNDFIVSLDHYIADERTEEEWDVLFQTGMPQALLDIASQPRLYREYFADDLTPEFVSFLHCCLTSILLHSTEECQNHLGHGAREDAPWVRYILQQFPRFCSVITDHPHLMILDGELEEEDGSNAGYYHDKEDGYNENISRLLMAQLFLNLRRGANRRRTETPDSSSALYAALLCFVYATNKRYHFDPLLSGFISVCDQHKMVTDQGFNTFIARALERHTFSPEQIMNQFLVLLMDDKILDQTLGMVVCTMIMFCDNPEVKRARAAQPSEVPYLLVFAAQRQMCSGDEEEVPGVLRSIFRGIGNYLKDTTTSKKFLSDRSFSHYMVLLLARVLVPAAMADEPLDDICGVTRIYSTGADILNARGSPDEVDFRAAVRRIWHKKREELEQLSPSVAPHRETIMDLWKEFGKKCDVDVNAPYDPAEEAEEAAPRGPGRMKRCAWRECLCFD